MFDTNNPEILSNIFEICATPIWPKGSVGQKDSWSQIPSPRSSIQNPESQVPNPKKMFFQKGILVKNKFGRHFFGPKKIWVKMFWSNILLAENCFWPKIVLGRKLFLAKNSFWPKIVYGRKLLLAENCF